MNPTNFEIAIALIDKKNEQDVNVVHSHDLVFSKELLYSQRMSQKLLQFKGGASEALQIAARAQHICRWKIPRNQFSMDRVGYLKWRETLKKMHADITSELLKTIGYSDEFIKRVSFLINKKMIKKDEESQVIEDVICLVFLDYYFEDFSEKHEDEKIISILQKTWKKMSDEGHKFALNLNYSEKCLSLIKKAIA